MATDRDIIKFTQAGALRTAATSTAIVDSFGEVGKIHTRSLPIVRTGSENAATNVAETAGVVIKRKSLLKAITLTSATAVTNSNTDHLKVYVYKYTSAGASKTLIGSWNSATAAQSATTAFAAHDLTLVGGATNVIAAGSVISYHVGKFNAGQALANFTIEVDAEEI